MPVDRRTALKAALGCAAGSILASRCRPSSLSQRGTRLDAHRLLLQAETFSGMTATHDQWKAPVTNRWTWVAYDLWQIPRPAKALTQTGAFMPGGAAATT